MKFSMCLILTIILGTGLFAEESLSTVKEEKITKSGRVLQLVSDKDTYNSETKSNSYRKFISTGKGSDKNETYSFILPEVKYFSENPYFFGQFMDDIRTLLIIRSKTCFYIFDAQKNQLSPVICPGKDKPWLGVDGRSGTLVGPVFNKEGTVLSGRIIHQGTFKYDISDPVHPVEIQYTTDFDIEQ